MKRVEALWEDDTHARRAASATILDLSAGGICLRISIPICIGSKLTIKGLKEQYSGIVINSHRDRGDYILGIRRDIPANPGTN